MICSVYQASTEDEAYGLYKNLIKVLLESGIDVNGKNKLGASALMEAIRLEHLDIVKLLLEHPKIDINATNNAGAAALTFAVIQGNAEAVQLLLNHPKIDVNLVDILLQNRLTFELAHANKMSADKETAITDYLKRKSLQAKASGK